MPSEVPQAKPTTPFGVMFDAVIVSGEPGAGDDAAADTLFGGQGRDELHGNAGNDVLHGGANDDLLMPTASRQAALDAVYDD